jgi:hypothetical protein
VHGAEEMDVLQNMSNILIKLNNVTTEKVTFKNPIPEPRMGQRGGNMQQLPKKAFTPKVVTAVVNKPLTPGVVKEVTNKYCPVSSTRD